MVIDMVKRWPKHCPNCGSTKIIVNETGMRCNKCGLMRKIKLPDKIGFTTANNDAIFYI
jgi:ribosomal protein S27AE